MFFCIFVHKAFILFDKLQILKSRDSESQRRN